MSVTLKIIGLIILLLFLYFIESVIFLVLYGEGSQASRAMDKGLIKLIMHALPWSIVIALAYKMFLKRKR